MVWLKHGCKPVGLLMLAILLMLSGCVGSVATPTPSQPTTRPDDNLIMLSYLQSSLDDFKVIDQLIDDEAFSDKITDDSLEKYLGILQDYDTKVKDKLTTINDRDTPDHPDIALFKSSEIAEFQLASDIIEEYLQVLNYYKSMTATVNEMNLASAVSSNDLQGTYDTISKSLSKAIDELKSDKVPSFWKSMNDNFIDALSQMQSAVYYILSSATLDDPVRANASLYRWGILTRKFSVISAEADQDLADRETKLSGDIENIKKSNDGLRDWVQKNIDKLNGL